MYLVHGWEKHKFLFPAVNSSIPCVTFIVLHTLQIMKEKECTSLIYQHVQDETSVILILFAALLYYNYSYFEPPKESKRELQIIFFSFFQISLNTYYPLANYTAKR